MNSNNKTVLYGDDLLTCKPEDYVNRPLSISKSSDTIGISSDGNGVYSVYQKGDRGMLDWEKSFDSFEDALIYAKSAYSDLLEFFKCLYRNGNEAAEMDSHTNYTSTADAIAALRNQLVENRESAVNYSGFKTVDAAAVGGDTIVVILQTLQAIEKQLDELLKEMTRINNSGMRTERSAYSNLRRQKRTLQSYKRDRRTETQRNERS